MLKNLFSISLFSLEDSNIILVLLRDHVKEKQLELKVDKQNGAKQLHFLMSSVCLKKKYLQTKY